MTINLDELARDLGSIVVPFRGGDLRVRLISAAEEMAVQRQAPDPPLLGRNELETTTYRNSEDYRVARAEVIARRMALRCGAAAGLAAGGIAWDKRMDSKQAREYAEALLERISDREFGLIHDAARGIAPPPSDAGEAPPDGAEIGTASAPGN